MARAQQDRANAAYEKMARNSGSSKSCFKKGTIVNKCIDSCIIPTPIEDIREGDLVLSQVDGTMQYVEAFLVRRHIYQGDICLFVMQDGQTISVTPNHCMLIATESDFNVRLAADVKAGQKFMNANGEKVEIKEVRMLLDQQTEVFDVVTPSFMIYANDFLACSYGEDTVNMTPQTILDNGMKIYESIGAGKCKVLYTCLEELAYNGHDIQDCFASELVKLFDGDNNQVSIEEVFD